MNVLGHKSQGTLSGLWIFLWWKILPWLLKDLEQLLHLNGFSSEWMIACRLSLKLFLQIGQGNEVSLIFSMTGAPLIFVAAQWLDSKGFQFFLNKFSILYFWNESERERDPKIAGFELCMLLMPQYSSLQNISILWLSLLMTASQHWLACKGHGKSFLSPFTFILFRCIFRIYNGKSACFQVPKNGT